MNDSSAGKWTLSKDLVSAAATNSGAASEPNFVSFSLSPPKLYNSGAHLSSCLNTKVALEVLP